MPVNYEGMIWEDGSNNDGGLAEYHYYAPRSWFDYVPEPTKHDKATNASEVVTITESFVLKSGKFWLPLYCTLESGELKSKLAGERDGMSYENTASLFFPGSKKEGAGWFETMKNTSFYLLVREYEGHLRLVGSFFYPAFIPEGEHTTGKEVTNRKGFSYSVQSKGRYAPYYEGDILTQEGVIPFGQYQVGP